MILKPDIEQAIDVVQQELARLLRDAPTDPIRTKLRNMNQVCRTLVVDARQRLTVPSVVRYYKGSFSDPEVSLAESSIRNKRSGVNPYNALYRTWESAAEVILISTKPHFRKEFGTALITEDDIGQIENDTVRHMVRLLWVRNRSLQNQINILSKVRGAPVVQIVGDESNSSVEHLSLPVTRKLILDEAEIEALRNFMNERVLRARSLRRADNGSVEFLDGRTLSDPGFFDAIEKIVQSYEQP
jgi:hypothetical protein